MRQPAWQLMRAKRLYQVVDERAGHRRPPLLAVSIHHGVVPRSSLTDDEHRADDLSAYKLCEAGDIVLNRMRAFQGAIGVAPSSGLVSPDYLVLRPGASADGRYLHHLFRSEWFVSEMALRLRGIGSVDQGNVRTPRINAEDLGEIRVPMPTPPEQRAIADFLDRETARIEALIAAKRRMIELLDEMYSARITQEISGGEDRCLAATADDWFPHLPPGWRLSSVGAVTHAILDGPHVSPTYVEESEGVPFISVRNISAHGWDLTTAKYISRADFELFCRRVKPELGDVLLTKGGNTGVAREVDLQFDFHVWVHVAILKVNRRIMRPSFLEAVLNSRPGYEQSQLGTRGATNQDLVLGRIAKIKVPVPPIEEQDQIVHSIRRATAPVRDATANLRIQIDLLTEHRQALITAAVTGQIEAQGAAA